MLKFYTDVTMEQSMKFLFLNALRLNILKTCTFLIN